MPLVTERFAVCSAALNVDFIYDGKEVFIVVAGGECNWNQFSDGGHPAEEWDGELACPVPVCPVCGREINWHTYRMDPKTKNRKFESP